jgi:lupus La protein
MKEKGIKGKAGSNNKEYTGNRREFNAFREMAKAKGKSTASGEQAKPEVWLEFMGIKIRVHDEDGGTIKDEDVPHIKGAALRFEGCGGELYFNDIKVCCQPRHFALSPHSLT